MPKRYDDKYQEGGILETLEQMPSDIKKLLRRLMGGPGQEDTERDMARAALMRESGDLMGGEEIPDWLAEDPELVQALLRSRPIKRPLPPLVTRENVGMMTPEEIKRWGGGNASGGIIGLQNGGEVPGEMSILEMLRAMGSKADSMVTSPRQYFLPSGTKYESLQDESLPRIALEMLKGGARNVAGVGRELGSNIRERIPEGIRERIREYAEENPPMGSPDWSPRWGPSRFGEGSLDPDREKRRGILHLLLDRIRGRADDELGVDPRDYMLAPGQLKRMRELREQPGLPTIPGLIPGPEDGWSPDAGWVDPYEEWGMGRRIGREKKAASGGIIGLQDGGVIGFQAGGNPYQQRMVQSYVSPEVAQPYADLTSRIQQVGGQAYTPYGGQRLAATTGDQALARAAYGAYGRGPGPAGTGQAAATMSQAGQMIGGAQQGLGDVASKFGTFAPQAQEQAQAGAEGMRGVGEQAGAPEMQRGADLSDYMSQYSQAALDPQYAAIRQAAQEQMSEMGSKAAMAGAGGGYRHGLGEQAIRQQQMQQVGEVAAKGAQQAHEAAVAGFQADRAAQAAGYGQQLEAQRGAGALEQQGFGTMGNLLRGEQGAYGQMGGLGSQMGQLGTAQQEQAKTEQQMLYGRLEGMEKAGARTQAEQQRDYDIAYQDFQRQQQHPQQMADWQLRAMSQLPYQNTQVIGDYGQAPSFGSDVTGAAGAYAKYQADQTATGDPAAGTTEGQTDPYGNTMYPSQEAADAAAAETPDTYTGEGLPDTPSADIAAETQDPMGGGAHGGYLSSSGILAPYHKKLIDGLYAGGRINY